MRWLLDRLTAGWIYQRCPCCEGEFQRVMYMGFPGKLCQDPECRTLVGPAMWATSIFFNGWFVTYEKGGYWRALWGWLTDKD